LSFREKGARNVGREWDLKERKATAGISGHLRRIQVFVDDVKGDRTLNREDVGDAISLMKREGTEKIWIKVIIRRRGMGITSVRDSRERHGAHWQSLLNGPSPKRGFEKK